MPETVNSDRNYTKKVLIAIGAALFFVVVLLLAYFAVDVIFTLLMAVLLAVLLHGLGKWVSRYTGMSDGISVLAVFVVLLSVLAVGVWQLAPEVSAQIASLQEVIPKSLENIRQRLAQYGWGSLLLKQIPAWEQILDNLVSSSFLARLGGIFSTTLGIAANIFVMVLLAVYLALEPRTYTDGLIKLFPIAKRSRMREVFAEVGETLELWLVGKFFSMLTAGTLATIGLYLIGVPLALTLGIVAGLLAFIPNFGPIIAAAPAILFAFVESPTMALYVVVLYIVIETIESYIITPLIQRKAVSLPPVLTIFFQILLGVLVGGLGLILATPLLAVIIVLVKMLYIEDVLGDRVTLPSEKNGGGEGEEEKE